MPASQAKAAAQLKAAQLAAEIAEMRRKITVQELRQAGKPVPPVRVGVDQLSSCTAMPRSSISPHCAVRPVSLQASNLAGLAFGLTGQNQRCLCAGGGPRMSCIRNARI